jgi:hypothetical protein
MKVVPYILMCGSEKFKTFLDQPFNINQLYLIKDMSEIQLFNGWRGKDMGTWNKLTNDENIVLEFYPSYYSATHPKSTAKYMIPLPNTINEFINDMHRCNVQLYWSEWIYENFEPKDYMHKDEIRDYFVTMLSRMDKSHELL